MTDKLDRYLMDIGDVNTNDENSINLISYTATPAIEIKGMAFNENIKLNFSTDEIKMRIVAPVMIPSNIYRFDAEEDYEYEVVFTNEFIENARNKFMQNLNNTKKFNINHTEEMTTSYLIETWIVGKDPKLDKSYSEFGIEVPSGTLMAITQFTDKQEYDKIIENKQYGFSIEGFFKLIKLDFKEQINKNKKEQIQMEDLKLPDGEHQIGDKIYVVKDGTITEVKDVVKPVEEVAAEDVKPEDTKPEEVKAEDVIEEVKPVEEIKAEVTPQDAEAVLAIVQPKLDDLYKIIADLKVLIEQDVEEDKTEETAPVQMNVNERFNQVLSFIKKK